MMIVVGIGINFMNIFFINVLVFLVLLRMMGVVIGFNSFFRNFGLIWGLVIVGMVMSIYYVFFYLFGVLVFV